MVTIKDVALKAGVSPSTVSRVIKGNKRISEATISKVKKVMEELNYFLIPLLELNYKPNI